MEALYGKIADTDDVLTNAEKRTLRVTYNILVNDVAKFRAELQRILAEQHVVGTVTWQWIEELNDWEDQELSYKNRLLASTPCVIFSICTLRDDKTLHARE